MTKQEFDLLVPYINNEDYAVVAWLDGETIEVNGVYEDTIQFDCSWYEPSGYRDFNTNDITVYKELKDWDHD